MLEHSLTQADAFIILLVFASIMISLTLWVTRRRDKTTQEFLLANRGVGVIAGAMSIGASWIWAPAMFVSSQKSYQQGVAGLFWYLAPNIGTLIIFGPFAAKLRTLLPSGYTLPQYMRVRHGPTVHALYLLQFLTLQICSLAVQTLAASRLLSATTGINPSIAGLMVVTIPLTYAMIGGLRASVATDYLQMLAMALICAITVPWAIINAGGILSVFRGFGGATGEYSNPLDPWVFYSFGIPITIGLLSGPLGDQMQWQRAYALGNGKRIRMTFTLGALIFGFVPLMLCSLGFLAANPNISAHWQINDPQMVAPIVIAKLLPRWMVVVYVIMVLIALCSTIDSSLCATASLVTTDIYALKEGRHRDTSERAISRLSMLLAACIGYGMAQIPHLQILHLFLFYGTMRAATMIPTILTLMWPKLRSKTMAPTILVSLLLGAPLMAIGNLVNNVHLSVLGSLLVVGIGTSGCYFGSLFRSAKERPN